MGHISEIWHLVEKVLGIFLLVCLCLYGVHSVMTGRLTTFDQFERFFRGLVGYIFG
jgi:hypothetical protein